VREVRRPKNTFKKEENTGSCPLGKPRRNAKCRHLKKLTCKGTLRQVFICLRPKTPYPSPLTHYSVLIHTGKGGEGGEFDQREGNRGDTDQKAGVENTDVTECTQEIGYLQSINSKLGFFTDFLYEQCH
jgi:hypothetical protein